MPGQAWYVGLAELRHHVAVIGATGSGKTTTLGRFVDAALSADWSVLIVDAKGGRLADISRELAAHHGVPSRIWLPGAADSWTYDVCAGEPTVIANRLIGAFQHGPEGEVYHNLSQAMLPAVARAVQQTGSTCDLDTVRHWLDANLLVGLARRVPDPLLKAELLGFNTDLHRKALAGLSGRLGALRLGTFGAWLLPSARTVDLGASLSSPGLTYLGLPATGASEDVSLIGRVLFQDLKQVAYAALWRKPAAQRAALVVFDEFASLREADQLIDLLLQAREARLAMVVSSQHVPKLAGLRHAILGAGMLVLHQIGSPDDADLLARAIGTRLGGELIRQVHIGPNGPFVRRWVRRVPRFRIPPDDLRQLAIGQAVVSVRLGQQRTAVVQVDPLPS
jgi:hypothetical protein